jgi:ribosome production factor 1
MVVTERLKRPNGLIIVKLPLGPTAVFKLRSAVKASDIKGHGAPTPHACELILNNFATRLGRRVGRVLGSLFQHNPDFTGRQVATFHNQRDFIFFRMHRYIFEGGDEIDDGNDFFLFSDKVDWIITNPPFSIFSKIIKHGLEVSDNSVWLLPTWKIKLLPLRAAHKFIPALA